LAKPLDVLAVDGADGAQFVQGIKAPKIVVQSVTKSFHERRRRARNVPNGPDRGETVTILNSIDLEIQSGEFIMLVGHSGCGKSTLLNVVAGFEKPTTGRVLIDGVEVAGPHPQRMFIFQENSLFPWMTVEENIESGLACAHTDGKTTVEELLKMVGLDKFAHYYPHQISGGMGRLAELARALAMNPDILFMDEPFSALDFMTRCLMREEMLNLMALFQTTIIFITHDLDEAVQLADRIVILSDRPASIKRIFKLPYPHPRDISSGELGAIRRQAYLEMGVNPVI
jgi:ABC-type nitrate/sulfonate/bicarbonate transport system ATPase subunit